MSPSLEINQKKQYKSSIGTILTVILVGIAIASCWIFGKDIILKENPTVQISEAHKVSPERFNIRKNTMNFAFGLTNKNGEHYLDESIYTINISQFQIKVHIDDSGQRKTVTTRTDLKSRQCQQSDFGVQLNYFHQLPFINQLYCVDNYDNTFLEGDFGQDIFATIHVDYLPCTENNSKGIKCKSEDEIKKTLSDNFFSIYVTDQVIDPTNSTNPFTDIGRNIYGTAEQGIFQNVDINYRHIHMIDNVGLLSENKNTIKGIQYQNQFATLKIPELETGQFLKLQLRLEKVKYTIYYRSYITLAQIAAQVLSGLKFVMLFFFVFAKLFSQKQYESTIIKQVKKSQALQLLSEEQIERMSISKMNTSQENKSSNCFNKLCKQKKKDKDQQNRKEQLIRSHINQSLDVVNILQMYYEIEYLKSQLGTKQLEQNCEQIANMPEQLRKNEKNCSFSNIKSNKKASQNMIMDKYSSSVKAVYTDIDDSSRKLDLESQSEKKNVTVQHISYIHNQQENISNLGSYHNSFINLVQKQDEKSNNKQKYDSYYINYQLQPQSNQELINCNKNDIDIEIPIHLDIDTENESVWQSQICEKLTPQDEVKQVIVKQFDNNKMSLKLQDTFNQKDSQFITSNINMTYDQKQQKSLYQ